MSKMDKNTRTAAKRIQTVPSHRFYRATACNATHGIAVGILSVRPSDACIVTKLNNALRTF